MTGPFRLQVVRDGEHVVREAVDVVRIGRSRLVAFSVAAYVHRDDVELIAQTGYVAEVMPDVSALAAAMKQDE